MKKVLNGSIHYLSRLWFSRMQPSHRWLFLDSPICRYCTIVLLIRGCHLPHLLMFCSCLREIYVSRWKATKTTVHSNLVSKPLKMIIIFVYVLNSISLHFSLNTFIFTNNTIINNSSIINNIISTIKLNIHSIPSRWSAVSDGSSIHIWFQFGYVFADYVGTALVCWCGPGSGHVSWKIEY